MAMGDREVADNGMFGLLKTALEDNVTDKQHGTHCIQCKYDWNVWFASSGTSEGCMSIGSEEKRPCAPRSTMNSV